MGAPQLYGGKMINDVVKGTSWSPAVPDVNIVNAVTDNVAVTVLSVA